jgi:hypothetical protein
MIILMSEGEKVMIIIMKRVRGGESNQNEERR